MELNRESFSGEEGRSAGTSLLRLSLSGEVDRRVLGPFEACRSSFCGEEGRSDALKGGSEYWREIFSGDDRPSRRDVGRRRCGETCPS